MLHLFDRMPGRIRRLREDDIPRVAQLHQVMQGQETDNTPAALTDHFYRIFLDHPWLDDSLSSLVYEENTGRITGCIGIMPRPMTFHGEKMMAAISHNFMVSPQTRASMAGLALAKAFLEGPQILSIAEGNSNSRRMWERFGGSVSLLNTLCWTRPVKPCRYLLSVLNRRGLPALAGLLLQPLCVLCDALPPFRQLRPPRPDFQEESLTARELCKIQRQIFTSCSLVPELDEKALDWQMQALSLRQDGSDVHKVLIRNNAAEAVGWFIYYGKRKAAGQVVQLGAKEGWGSQVLDHLFHHAGEQGVTALSGQFNPRLFSDLSRKFGIYHNDGESWMLIHSHRPELLSAINAGDAFLTRLEGEWWINYIHNQ